MFSHTYSIHQMLFYILPFFSLYSIVGVARAFHFPPVLHQF